MSNRKLLTCRYWAFGPRCPNMDANGVDTCEYAHWDTGRLSNFYKQRGTCWHWAHPRLNCHFGAICTFEHRDTGFMGTHHGILELVGLNLQIADAARKSGFNTRNHIALLDLIWSVRRVIFSHSITKPSFQPPPKHPTCPDRHRPRVQGIDSGSSRKRTRETEAETEAHAMSCTAIDLEAESEDKFLIAAGPKRQKTTFGLIVNPTTTKCASGPPNPIHPSRFPNSRLSNVRTRGKENIPPTRTMYMPSPRSLNLPPPRESPSAPKSASLAVAFPNTQHRLLLSKPRYSIHAFNQQQESLYKLRRVSQTLCDNLDAISDCQRVMKTLYDTDDKVRHHDIFSLLLKLRDDLQDSESGTLDALKGVSGVISFLDSGGKHSAIGMDEID